MISCFWFCKCYLIVVNVLFFLCFCRVLLMLFRLSWFLFILFVWVWFLIFLFFIMRFLIFLIVFVILLSRFLMMLLLSLIFFLRSFIVIVFLLCSFLGIILFFGFCLIMVSLRLLRFLRRRRLRRSLLRRRFLSLYLRIKWFVYDGIVEIFWEGFFGILYFVLVVW